MSGRGPKAFFLTMSLGALAGAKEELNPPDAKLRWSRGGVGGQEEDLDLVLVLIRAEIKLSFPNDDSVEDVSEEGDEEIIEDARLSVTQSDDPRSGGHFALGMSKSPLREDIGKKGKNRQQIDAKMRD